MYKRNLMTDTVDAVLGLLQDILTLCEQVTRVVGISIKRFTKKNLNKKAETKTKGK